LTKTYPYEFQAEDAIAEEKKKEEDESRCN